MTHRALVCTAAIMFVALSAGAASAFPRAMARLRPASAAVGALIDDAVTRSATVRALVRELAATDVIVHVALGRPEAGAAASTFFVTATPHARYLRITLDTMMSPHDMIPLLAHELEHALEIARHPEVRSSTGMRRLYERIGTNARGLTSYETDGARLTERRARAEAMSARAKGRDMP